MKITNINVGLGTITIELGGNRKGGIQDEAAFLSRDLEKLADQIDAEKKIFSTGFTAKLRQLALGFGILRDNW